MPLAKSNCRYCCDDDMVTCRHSVIYQSDFVRTMIGLAANFDQTMVLSTMMGDTAISLVRRDQNDSFCHILASNKESSDKRVIVCCCALMLLSYCKQTLTHNSSLF